MGGVVARNIHIWPQLLEFLGQKESDVLVPEFQKAQHEYGLGLISEDEIWSRYTRATGKAVPPHEGSLMGKFFAPLLDEPTVQLIRDLKKQGLRVVCGTNTGDAHYVIHNKLNQYAVFDKVYASQLIHISKPDAAFYYHILDAEGAKPAEAFFTDDYAQNVEAAAKLGITAFLFTDAAALRNDLRSIGIAL
jgi:putative hydrolase of the HAD superfamily